MQFSGKNKRRMHFIKTFARILGLLLPWKMQWLKSQKFKLLCGEKKIYEHGIQQTKFYTVMLSVLQSFCM